MSKFVEATMEELGDLGEYDDLGELGEYGADELSSEEAAALAELTASDVSFDWKTWAMYTVVGASIGYLACQKISPQATKKAKLLSAGAGAGVGTFVHLWLTTSERLDDIQDQIDQGLLPPIEGPDDTGF